MEKEEQELLTFFTILRRYDWVVQQQIKKQILDWTELAEIKTMILSRLNSSTIEEVTNQILINSSREKVIQLTRNFDALFNSFRELNDVSIFELEASLSTKSFSRQYGFLELETKELTEQFTEVRKQKESLERSLDNYFYVGDDIRRLKAEFEIERIEPIFKSKLRDYEAKIYESKQFFDGNFKLTRSILQEVVIALTVRIKPLFDIYRENSSRDLSREYFSMSLVGVVYDELKDSNIIQVDGQTFYEIINLKKVGFLSILPNMLLYYLIDSFARRLDGDTKASWIEEIRVMQNIKQSSYMAHYRDLHDSRKWKKLYGRLEKLFNVNHNE